MGLDTGIRNRKKEIAYWRKANMIHKWFVDNVQKGNDDCKEYKITKEHLEELLKLSKEVFKHSKLIEGKIQNGYKMERIAGALVKIPIVVDGKYIEDSTFARENLPTESGFSFGYTHYDEWYIYNIEETIKQLEKILKEEDTDEMYYWSSW